MERSARHRLLVLWAILAVFAAVGGAVAAVRPPGAPPSAVLPAPTPTPTPSPADPPPHVVPWEAERPERGADSGPAPLPRGTGVWSTLRRAHLRGHVRRGRYRRWRADLAGAREALRVLTGARRAELATALGGVERLAGARQLTVSRMPLAFLTLRRNTTVWRSRAFPAPAERMIFGRDPAVFQYFPGRGVQFHALGTAGQANALAAACLRVAERRLAAANARAARAAARRRVGTSAGADPRVAPAGAPAAAGRRGGCKPGAVRRRLDRLVGLSSRRGGFRAWESLYDYGGGTAPWISGMTQGTVAQALARGAVALGERAYAAAAEDALGAFDAPPPVGVRAGDEYLMYSFAPGLHIVNGFAQAVVGLHDVADLTGSARARRLYARGERTVRRILPGYDTGAWSLYSAGGREATLDYHRLVTGFLGDLCERTSLPAYCESAARFTRYEREPPRIGLRVPALREARPATVRVALSKVSTTRVVVRDRRGTVLARSGTLPYGRYAYAFTPRRPGPYRVVVTATGPEGRRAVARRAVTAAPDPVRLARERAARRRAAAQRRAEARRKAAAQRRATARREAAAKRRARGESTGEDG